MELLCMQISRRARRQLSEREALTGITGLDPVKRLLGSRAALRSMAPGGPRVVCKRTESSYWYGGSGAGVDQYCKRRECMRTGGYSPPAEAEATAHRDFAC